jgi:hypothetical protein
MLRSVRLLALTVLAFAALAAPAQARTTWLCHPRLAADPCRTSLDTTVFSPWDQRRGVVEPRRARRPAVDCFYVYPTVSDQPTTLANRRIDPPIRSIARFQAARYSQHCRVFAPVYRQLTIAGIQRPIRAADARRAYGDVLAAWREYLARHSRGRGVVLIGHSQGTGHLTRLVRTQIDRRPAVRRRLVSAILLGGNVAVKAGRDAGGSFRNVRACRSRTQLGCVIAFSTFGETPPAEARFGRDPSFLAGLAPGGGPYEVLCTNPAALGGGAAPLDAILPAAPFAPGSLIAAGIALLQIPVPQASTTFIEARDAYSGRCVSEDGAGYLEITPRPGAPAPRPSPDANWGLHLMDGNIALGDLLDVVKAQIDRYRARRR